MWSIIPNGVTGYINAAVFCVILAPFIEHHYYRITAFVLGVFLVILALFRAHAERQDRKERRRQRTLRTLYTKEILQKSLNNKKRLDKRALLERPSLLMLNLASNREDYEKYMYTLIKSIEEQKPEPEVKTNKINCGASEATLYFRKLCMSLLDFLGFLNVKEAPKNAVKNVAKMEQAKAVIRRNEYKNLLLPNEKGSEKKKPRKRFENTCCSKLVNNKNCVEEKNYKNNKLQEKLSDVSEKKVKIDDEIEFLKLFDDWIKGGRKQASFLEMLDQKQKAGRLKKQHYSMFLVVFFDTVLNAKQGRFSEDELDRLKSDFFQYLEKQEYIGAISYEERQDIEEHFFYMLARKQNLPNVVNEPKKCPSSSTKLFQDVLELLDYINVTESQELFETTPKPATAAAEDVKDVFNNYENVKVKVKAKQKPEKCVKIPNPNPKNCNKKNELMKKKVFNKNSAGIWSKLWGFFIFLLTFWMAPFKFPIEVEEESRHHHHHHQQQRPFHRKCVESKKKKPQMHTIKDEVFIAPVKRETSFKEFEEAPNLCEVQKEKVQENYKTIIFSKKCPVKTRSKVERRCLDSVDVNFNSHLANVKLKKEEEIGGKGDNLETNSTKISELWNTMATIIESDIENKDDVLNTTIRDFAFDVLG